MKKISKFIILALILVLSLSLFVGCASNGNDDTKPPIENPSDNTDNSSNGDNTVVEDNDFITKPGDDWNEIWGE